MANRSTNAMRTERRDWDDRPQVPKTIGLASLVRLSATGLLIVALMHSVWSAPPKQQNEAAKPGSAASETKEAEAKSKAPQQTASRNQAVDQETEQQVISLVHTHLPDLRPILDRLHQQHPRQYQRAIRDLARTSRKLKIAQQRDPQLYELELDLWKAHNRINLLVARLKVRDSKADRKALLEAVGQQQSAKRKRVQYDVETLTNRVERSQQLLKTAQTQLDKLDQSSSADETAEYEQLLRKIGRQPDP